MKKILSLITLLLTLTGCISYKELNDIGIINAIGIDYKDNTYMLTISMFSGDLENEDQTSIYKTTSSNIEDCFNKIYNTSTKKAYLAHTNLLILSNNIAKENYIDIFNMFLNRPDSRNSFNIVILEDYNEKIFETDTSDINNLLKINSEEASIIKEITLDEVIRDVLEMNMSYIPILKNNKKLEIVGYKSIYEDNKQLDLEESLALNFIRNDINKALITINNINYQINNSSTTLLINKNNIDIKINTNLLLFDETYNTDQYLNEYKQYIKTIINNFIFNNKLNYFYNKIYKYDYKYYIKNQTPNINFNINIDLTINKNNNIKGSDYFDSK